MHWRPGTVSSSVGEAPTAVKLSCAARTCSSNPVAWPCSAQATPCKAGRHGGQSSGSKEQYQRLALWPLLDSPWGGSCI
jgi:hypothetical protein